MTISEEKIKVSEEVLKAIDAAAKKQLEKNSADEWRVFLRTKPTKQLTAILELNTRQRPKSDHLRIALEEAIERLNFYAGR